MGLLEFLFDSLDGAVVHRGDRRSGDRSSDPSNNPFTDPSHVCRSCGEEYYTDADVEIGTCRSCGGVKVERA